MAASAGSSGARAPGRPAKGPPGVLPVDLGPGVRAGFTLRGPGRPGTSGGAGAGTAAAPGNLGLGVGDDRDAVLARRRALAAWAGAPLAWVTQVHGSAVLVASPASPAAGAAVSEGTALAEADAVVVGRGGGAAVVVADCVPVLLADAAAGVAAAVHAGRRGLLDGVVQATVDAMVRAGARPERLRAAVGPAICGQCYEVPAALRDEVADVVPAVAARTSWGTPALDLPAGVAAVLARAGVAAVHRTGWCTHTDDRFWSHRRSTRTGEAPGRSAGVVALPGRLQLRAQPPAGTDPDAGRVGPGW